VIPLINPPLVYLKEKKYNALGRRCICAKIRNPIANSNFQGYFEWQDRLANTSLGAYIDSPYNPWSFFF
jgi:hypothetical protein